MCSWTMTQLGHLLTVLKCILVAVIRLARLLYSCCSGGCSWALVSDVSCAECAGGHFGWLKFREIILDIFNKPTWLKFPYRYLLHIDWQERNYLNYYHRLHFFHRHRCHSHNTDRYFHCIHCYHCSYCLLLAHSTIKTFKRISEVLIGWG